MFTKGLLSGPAGACAMVALVAASVMLLPNDAYGSIGGRSGSTTSVGCNQAGCHTTNNPLLTGSGTVSFPGGDTTLRTNTNYGFNFNYSSNAPAAGFNLDDSGSPAGTFTFGGGLDDPHTLDAGVSITHRRANTSKSWAYTWNYAGSVGAPTNITFRWCGRGVNNNTTDTLDQRPPSCSNVTFSVQNNIAPVITPVSPTSASCSGVANCVTYVYPTTPAGTRLVNLSANDANTDENSGTLSYSWNSASGLSSGSVLAPNYTGTTRIQRTLTATDEVGATDTQIVVLDLDPIPVANISYEGATGTAGTAEENAAVSFNGAVSTDALDSVGSPGTIASYSWQVLEGGSAFNIGGAPTNNSTLNFTAPNVVGIGDTRSLVVRLTVTDNRSQSSVVRQFALTVQDAAITDPAPVITSISATPSPANEGDTVTLQATVNEPGATTSWTQVSNGAPVVALAGTGLSRTFSYTEPVASAIGPTFEFQFTADDGINFPVTSNITVKVNNAPTANAGADGATDELTPVALNGSATVAPDGPATYAWTPSANLTGADTLNPTYTPAPVGRDGLDTEFTLTVTGAGGLTSTDSATVSVANVNQPPVAIAPDDQTVNEGAVVTLAGDFTDPDEPGSTITWTWDQTGGTTVALTDGDTATPTFTAHEVGPAGELLTFTLTVTDEAAATSAADTTLVQIDNVNRAPVAEAGPVQTVAEGDSVTLNGSNSDDDDDRDVLVYAWQQTGGVAATLDNATIAMPSFTAPQIGFDSEPVLTFVLTVTDIPGLTGTDTVMINVSNDNLPPVANAGMDITTNENVLVTLNGSGSTDPDLAIDDALAFAWVQTAGASIGLTGADTATPSFTAPEVTPAGQSATFSLTVTDRGGLVATDEVIVNITNVNQPPTADAGPDQTVAEDATATVDGSNSRDPDGGITAFRWTQIGGPAVTLSDPSAASTSFTAPRVAGSGAITLRLTVTGDAGLEASDTVIVNVSDVSAEPPVAQAGADQSVNELDVVMLDGSASFDPDGNIATFLWRQTAGPVVQMSDPNRIAPTFTAPIVAVAGVALTFELTVTDSDGAADTDSVIVNVSNVAVPPVANAGAGMAVQEGTTVILDGSGSSDPGDISLLFAWRQTAGASVVLSDPAGVRPTFVAPAVTADTVLTFELAATNGDGMAATDSVSVTVSDNGITGFADNQITLVTATPAAEPVGIDVAGGNLVSIVAVAASTVSEVTNRPESLPTGLFDIRVVVTNPGDVATVTLQFSSPLPAGSGWAKYSTATGWTDFSGNVVVAADGLSAAVELVDGGAGDDDGVANGVIVDPSGPATFAAAPPAAPPTLATAAPRSKSGGGGCSLAAPGQPVDPTLPVLVLLAACYLLRRRIFPAVMSGVVEEERVDDQQVVAGDAQPGLSHGDIRNV